MITYEFSLFLCVCVLMAERYVCVVCYLSDVDLDKQERANRS